MGPFFDPCEFSLNFIFITFVLHILHVGTPTEKNSRTAEIKREGKETDKEKEKVERKKKIRNRKRKRREKHENEK